MSSIETSNTTEWMKKMGVSDTEIKKIALKEERLVKIEQAKIESKCEELTKEKGSMLIKLCQAPISLWKPIAAAIGDGRIDTNEKLTAAIDFVKSVEKSGKNATYSVEDLNKNSGVGVVVDQAFITNAINETLKMNVNHFREFGQKFKIGVLKSELQKNFPNIKFANQQVVVKELTASAKKFLENLPEQEEPVVSTEEKVKEISSFEGVVQNLPSIEENVMNNSPEILKKHLEATGGKVMTRFPPEPNGWLHIGHAKAMLLDFGYAEAKGGHCYMRFDDTNPTKEREEFIEGIKKDVNWMGFQWYKITHTSDYFDQLYQFAIQLIKENKAYVCQLSKEKAKELKEARLPSPYRDRPVEENLLLFEKMRMGYFAPKEAVLRLKQDYKNDNKNMWDPVAYRIKYMQHPRTGDKWCIYPSYDYSHSIIDSLENITHSLCTLEFVNRRPLYYWSVENLGIYKAYEWEFSRLNITHTVMSKRRLQMLVEQHLVNGWDDPRMPTLAGYRRRGFTASAIKKFAGSVGFSRNPDTMVDVSKLENIQKMELDQTSPRAFCVLDPIEVVIEGEIQNKIIKAPILPKDKASGEREIPLSNIVYIDREDFCVNPPKDYKRLTPEGIVGLKYANVILKCTKYEETDGKVTKIYCSIVENQKPNCYIHWVSDGAIKAEIRLYDDLLKTANTTKNLPDPWYSDLNENSLIIIKNALIEPSVKGCKELDRYQFERLGYFAVDYDTKGDNLVLNRTLPLLNRKADFKEEE